MLAIEQLRTLSASKRMSARSKEAIKATAEELGYDFHETNCPDCWRDACHVLARMIAERMPVDGARKYLLRSGLDVRFRGQRINASTITTDAEVLDLLNQGFPQKFVTVCK